MKIASNEEFAPGTEVEVRTHYLSSWAGGFEVVSVEGDQVGLRRRSDGAILPVALAADDVRLPQTPGANAVDAAAEMREIEVWTVSLLLRAEYDKTRADAFLQGPAVELECSAWADLPPDTTGLTPFGEDLAAARAFDDLSRRLVERSSERDDVADSG